MKRWITSSIFAAFLALLPSYAQEVSYALPSTTLLVKVEIEQEQFFAGPYAEFAKRMLNIDVKKYNDVACHVVSAELGSAVEADPGAWYTCEPENASLLALSAQGLVSLGNNAAPVTWRFPAPAKADFTEAALSSSIKDLTRVEYRQMVTEEGDTLRVPIEHRMRVDKTLEDKAAEAADKVLSLHQERLDIASGNTDASYAGEALAAAIEELKNAEQEYLSLFRGYTVKRTQTAVFEVVPEAGNSVQRYLAFRLTDNGPVTEGTRGVPFYIELEPEPSKGLEGENQDRKKGRPVLYYRIPAICKVTFTQDGKTLLQTRLPIYQLGKESTFPAIK